MFGGVGCMYELVEVGLKGNIDSTNVTSREINGYIFDRFNNLYPFLKGG